MFHNSSFTIKSIKNMNALFLHENAEDKSQFNVADYGCPNNLVLYFSGYANDRKNLKKI